MPIVLSSDDRKAMSRRLVKIDDEIAAFTVSKNSAVVSSGVYEETDDMNHTLIDFYHGIATSYETERRALSGVIAGTFNEADLVNSAKEIVGNIFYPITIGGGPNDPYLIPGTIDTTVPPDGVSDSFVAQINGSQVGLDAQYESNVLDSPSIGIKQITTILKTGFTLVAGGATTLSSTYTPGDLVLHVTNGANFANGEYAIAKKTGGGIS